MGPPGHLAIGFAAKPAAPRAPLWILLLATEGPDLLSFGFGAIGLESWADTHPDLSRGITVLSQGYLPWSHGLFMSVVWSFVLAVIAFLVYRDRRTSVVV